MIPALFACPECDALQRERPQCDPLNESRAAEVVPTSVCWRCGAMLERGGALIDNERALAVTLAAAALFCIANFFPLFTLDYQGSSHSTSLFGAVRSLWHEGMWLVGLLVFVTTMLFPALEIAVLIYVFTTFLRGAENDAPALRPLLRILSTVARWGMIEVFMLGSLVSVVKLGRIASVEVGAALWSFGAVMLLLAAVGSSFEPRRFWARLDLLR